MNNIKIGAWEIITPDELEIDELGGEEILRQIKENPGLFRVENLMFQPWRGLNEDSHLLTQNVPEETWWQSAKVIILDGEQERYGFLSTADSNKLWEVGSSYPIFVRVSPKFQHRQRKNR